MKYFSTNHKVEPVDLRTAVLQGLPKDKGLFMPEEISVMPAEKIWEQGIGETISHLLEKYKDYDAVYITVDVDVLDPAYAPGTGTPEAGGLPSRELMQIMKKPIAGLPVKVFDLVEVSPLLDSSDITSWAALKLIYEVFGQVYLKG